MFRHLLYRFLVSYVKWGLKFYFSRLEVHGIENIPSTGAVMFAANHQNSFLDALIIAAFQQRKLHFLVRADVFRKSWASRLLRTLNMMPVFRFRDGWPSLGRNAETFQQVVTLLSQKQAVLIFPEGNHSLLRRLRPLSRGFTKPLAQTLQEYPDLKITLMPTGLNFSDHMAFRSGASVCFGKPIVVSEFIQNGQLDANALRSKLSDEMKHLIIHIEDESTCLAQEAQLKLAGIDLLNPNKANQFLCTEQSEVLIETQSNFLLKRFARFIFRLLHFPILMGWNKIRSKITDPVFTASIKFVYGIFAIPIYYLILFSLLSSVLGFGYSFGLITIMLMSILMDR